MDISITAFSDLFMPIIQPVKKYVFSAELPRILSEKHTKRNLLTGEEEIIGEVPERVNAYPLMQGNITDHYLYLDFTDGLWQCDHDGNKLRMVQTPEQKAANPISGYRWILTCDKWILHLGNTAFSAYDMENGEYTFYEFSE